MKIAFTKMHGLGNDFMVIDAPQQTIQLSPSQIQQLADRHYGVGFDQLLLLEPVDKSRADFLYRIFNADGQEAEQCGNGARCMARFMIDKGLAENQEIRLATQSDVLALKVEDGGQITVNMGIPTFGTQQRLLSEKNVDFLYNISIVEKTYPTYVVHLGNPHAVLFVDNVDTAPVVILGKKLQEHSLFPNSVNVGFMEFKDAHHIRLRVYERGAGETLACGSGACAAVVAGTLSERLTGTVKVDLLGGSLSISWKGDQQPVFMTGPAETVYEGVISI